jgi:hypothetical protein
LLLCLALLIRESLSFLQLHGLCQSAPVFALLFRLLWSRLRKRADCEQCRDRQPGAEPHNETF